MNRSTTSLATRRSDFLYARGDEPFRLPKPEVRSPFSLRTWRWTAVTSKSWKPTKIFSTHVEMNRDRNFRFVVRQNFLYARGDEPVIGNELGLVGVFSLRTWRWTACKVDGESIQSIFSTHVEMNRNYRTRLTQARHFLYARGDEPSDSLAATLTDKFSLRTWRWTDSDTPPKLLQRIFSTHVEMNRKNRRSIRRC